MTFLPIVERELRVAARKRGTYYLRVTAALVGLLLGGGFMVTGRLGGAGTANLGSALFALLTWMLLVAALTAGLFFTSDCLSEEKREGTLGFLFLTDLRGFDVVGGKLLATSLRGSYALLALFPVLATTLLMGGVTGAQFWKTVLALVNALFYSLAFGLFISALSRDSQKALAATLLGLLVLVAGGPMVDAILGGAKGRVFVARWSLGSPGYVFAAAAHWGRSPYWVGLGLSHGLAWIWLALASLLLPRTWQEKAHQEPVRSSRSYRWRYGGVRYRVGLRQKLLERNPVLWLACRERRQSVGVWVMAGLLVSGVALLLAVAEHNSMLWAMWSTVSGLFLLLLYLWTASQACRFFVEARRSGMMELLLAAPLRVEEILQGQWRALLRLFGLPVVVILGMQLVVTLLAQNVTIGRVTIGAGVPSHTLAVAVVSAASGVASTAANLVALSWFGMWMGLTSRNANFAILKTLVFVQVIPGFIISFVAGIFSALLFMPRMMRGGGGAGAAALLTGWMPLLMVVVPVLLSLAKDAGFYFWTRARLYSSFRLQAARNLSLVRFEPALVPPVLAPPPLPPAR